MKPSLPALSALSARALRPAVALLVVPALVALAPGAHAATATCHGQAATTVGTQGQVIDGTSAHQVIVTNGASAVFTNGGDDLVCVTGTPGATTSSVGVYTMDGDTVDASASGKPIFAGIESDTQLVGSPYADFIGVNHEGPGNDTVSSGAGGDTVVVGPVSGSSVPADHIDLGTGDDDLLLEGDTEARANLVGGTGKNELSLYDSTASPVYTVDLATSRFGSGATASTLTGFTTVAPSGSWHSLSVVGGDRDETVSTVHEATAHQGPVSIHLGGGDDHVTLARRTTGVVDGGSGDNVLISTQSTAPSSDKATTVSLKKGTIGDAGVVTHVQHFTRLQVVGAVKATVTGTPHRDVVIVNACEAKISGLGGNDQLRFSLPPTAGTCKNPPAVRGRIYGGGGNDVLSGSSKKDVLIGGAGSDQIDGHGGHDTCVAERKISCG